MSQVKVLGLWILLLIHVAVLLTLNKRIHPFSMYVRDSTLRSFNSFLGQRDFKRARRLLLEALTDNPDSADYLEGMGKLALREGNEEEATHWFQRSRQAKRKKGTPTTASVKAEYDFHNHTADDLEYLNESASAGYSMAIEESLPINLGEFSNHTSKHEPSSQKEENDYNLPGCGDPGTEKVRPEVEEVNQGQKTRNTYNPSDKEHRHSKDKKTSITTEHVSPNKKKAIQVTYKQRRKIIVPSLKTDDTNSEKTIAVQDGQKREVAAAATSNVPPKLEAEKQLSESTPLNE